VSTTLAGGSATALTLPAELLLDEWLDIGRRIGRIEGAVSWWVGDWWAYGRHCYGARKALIDSDDWEGPSFQRCMNCASVCRTFPTSRRREDLSFAHHEACAGLSKGEARRLLEWAAEPLQAGRRARSVAHLRDEVRVLKARKIANKLLPALAAGPVRQTYQRQEWEQREAPYRGPPVRWVCLEPTTSDEKPLDWARRLLREIAVQCVQVGLPLDKAEAVVRGVYAEAPLDGI
jgi:hypothetical protein